jgi:hypothetical protein
VNIGCYGSEVLVMSSITSSTMSNTREPELEANLKARNLSNRSEFKLTHHAWSSIRRGNHGLYRSAIVHLFKKLTRSSSFRESNTPSSWDYPQAIEAKASY